MNADDVIEYLNNVPDERLVAVLRQVFAVKQPAPQEAAYSRNRFDLGTAWSDLESDEGEPLRLPAHRGAPLQGLGSAEPPPRAGALGFT